MKEKIIDLLYDENVRCDCGIEWLAEEICTIDPVKHGRWKKTEDFPFPEWVCSRCNTLFCGTEEFPKKYKYCPNCGARMDGEER